MDTSIIHRCTDPECCSFGRPSSRSCGCHKDGIQVLIEQRDALLAALTLSLIRLAPREPGDSRAVSDDYVAMASVACGVHNDASMSIIRSELAKAEAEGRAA